MITRPYEGLAAAVPVVVSVAWRVRPAGAGPPSGVGEPRRARIKTVLPILVAFAPIAIWAGYYDFRVTGSPVRLPYTTYERRYAAAPTFLFQRVRPVPADIPVEMQNYARDVEIPHFQSQLSAAGFAAGARVKFRELFGKSAGLKPATIPMPAACVAAGLLVVAAGYAAWRRPVLRVPAGVTVFVLAATLVSNWTRSQYVAPAAGAVLVLGVFAVRELERWSARTAWVVTAAAIAAAAAGSAASAAKIDHGTGRSDLAASLAQEPGRQIVLVRYTPDYSGDVEWVENGADIDSQQTVWARDPGPGSGRELLNYFHDRTVWRLTIGKHLARIEKVPVDARTMPGEQ
jgi:hypothetical protein